MILRSSCFHHFIYTKSVRTKQSFFFFNDTATTEIYTLSLHDALPICPSRRYAGAGSAWTKGPTCSPRTMRLMLPFSLTLKDRKSTRLNSSHLVISYAAFCLKKKKQSSNGHTSSRPPFLHLPTRRCLAI